MVPACTFASHSWSRGFAEHAFLAPRLAGQFEFVFRVVRHLPPGVWMRVEPLQGLSKELIPTGSIG